MINDCTTRGFHITALRSVKINIVFNFSSVTLSYRVKHICDYYRAGSDKILFARKKKDKIIIITRTP